MEVGLDPFSAVLLITMEAWRRVSGLLGSRPASEPASEAGREPNANWVAIIYAAV